MKPVRLSLTLGLSLILAACRPGGTGAPAAPQKGSPQAASPVSASVSGTGDCRPVGDRSKSQRTIRVALDEWSIRPDVSQAPAGTITFLAENKGQEPHEIVILRGQDPKALPTAADGAADESKLDKNAEVGEIEEFPKGMSCDGTFQLTPGPYIFLCNIVEKEPDGTVESHYQKGMVTTFTVTG